MAKKKSALNIMAHVNPMVLKALNTLPSQAHAAFALGIGERTLSRHIEMYLDYRYIEVGKKKKREYFQVIDRTELFRTQISKRIDFKKYGKIKPITDNSKA